MPLVLLYFEISDCTFTFMMVSRFIHSFNTYLSDAHCVPDVTENSGARVKMTKFMPKRGKVLGRGVRQKGVNQEDNCNF